MSATRPTMSNPMDQLSAATLDYLLGYESPIESDADLSSAVRQVGEQCDELIRLSS